MIPSWEISPNVRGLVACFPIALRDRISRAFRRVIGDARDRGEVVGIDQQIKTVEKWLEFYEKNGKLPEGLDGS